MRRAGKNNLTPSFNPSGENVHKGSVLHLLSACRLLSARRMLSVRRLLSVRRKTLKRFAFPRFVAVATK